MENKYILITPLIPPDYGFNIFRLYFIINMYDQISREHSNWHQSKAIYGRLTSISQKNESYLYSLDDAVNSISFDAEKYKTISLRMNPWKRMICYYEALLGDKHYDEIMPHAIEVTGLHDFNTFDDFIQLAYRERDRPILQNQVDYFNLSDGTSIDYLLDFDNIKNDLLSIPEFKDNDDTDIFFMHKYWSDIYQKYYNEETRDIVAEMYAKDIEAYGYRF